MSVAIPLPGEQTPKNPPDLSQKLPRLTPRRRARAQDEGCHPAPPTPALAPPPDLQGHKFLRPSRRILSPRDHDLFLASPTHDLIVSFVFHLSDAVRDQTMRGVHTSAAARDPAIVALLGLLEEAEGLLRQHPALDTGSRFGNPAFRDFVAAVADAAPRWHGTLGITDPDAQAELSTYLANAFGDGRRIDYGSGHELNFVLWLLCLRQLARLPDATRAAVGLVVFPRYLRLMRAVQTTYYLEPAGSHGVWGLDDYQFLPFLFGASQLAAHKHLRPLSIHNPLVLEECAADYLYLDQIQWVNATKTVRGLRWHSPMLDDISAAKSWAKVEAGMRKMFLAEVLGKLPVAQHFLFGSLLPAAEGMSRDVEEGVGECEGAVDGTRHVHNASSGWGDCCGIKVPSAVGARQEAQKHGAGGGLRRVPFD